MRHEKARFDRPLNQLNHLGIPIDSLVCYNRLVLRCFPLFLLFCIIVLLLSLLSGWFYAASCLTFDCCNIFLVFPIADQVIEHAIVRKYFNQQSITLHHQNAVCAQRGVTCNVTEEPITVLPIKIDVYILFPISF